jgi:phenylacetic acid degradation operon negative regulatory protein
MESIHYRIDPKPAETADASVDGRLHVVNARSALFDLFGDHLRQRGGAAPVASLVRILAPLGVTPPAVRTAISRMVRQGWLVPKTFAAGPGYRLTPAAERRLAEAADRIYRITPRHWDGRWHLLVIATVAERPRRDRVSNALAFLGFGRLTPTTWVSPFASADVDELVAAEHLVAEQFVGASLGDPATVAAAAWDLDGLAGAYERWQLDAELLLDGGTGDDEDAFVRRSQLVHEWRKFLFRDPGLPDRLLPPSWPGHAAAGFFDEHAGALLPGAARYVDSQLDQREMP